MKNVSTFLFRLYAVLFLPMLFLSCAEAFTINPNTAEIEVNDRSICAPAGLLASHGDYRKITLSWNLVSNAKQYIIYSAPSPFDEFVKIGETSGSVSEFSVDVASGKMLWFRLSSLSYTGTESSKSGYVFGSSVAVPNITGIVLGADGKSAEVSWWLSNCRDDTYASSVSYTVVCYEGDGERVFDTKTQKGPLTSVCFYGLDARAKYSYQVLASVGNFKAEKSDLSDAESARLTVPSAPENFFVERGVKKAADGIVVSWTLPPPAHCRISSDVYEEHPLYFSIQRKLSSEPDSAYADIVQYIGTVDAPASGVYFNCDGDSHFSDLYVERSAVQDVEAGRVPNYPGYIVGTKLSYADRTAEQGKLYSYIVRSFTDDVSGRTVSSDSSFTVGEGHLVSSPSLELVSDYVLDGSDENKFSNIHLGLNFNFEDFSLDGEGFYSYLLSYEKTPFATAENPEPSSCGEVFVSAFSSVESIRSYEISYGKDFVSDSENHGYYTYRVYVAPSSLKGLPSSDSEFYTSVRSSSSLTVTDDASSLPLITEFSVQDGYASKYVLCWNYEPSYSYSLKWTLYDGRTGQPASDAQVNSIDIQEGDLDITSVPGKAFFTHGAESGDSRKYTLVARNGLYTAKDFEEVSRTLGTANARLKALSYDSVNISWDSVQRADSYSVVAFYAHDLEKTNLVREAEDGGTNCEISLDGGTYTCTIVKPSGYDSALLSGREITVEVTAKNSKRSTDNSTSKTVSARTFGPSVMQAAAGNLYEKNINIGWQEIEGAKGYLVSRVMYEDGNAVTASDAADVYFVDASSLELKRNGERPPEGSSASRKDGKIWLNDVDDTDCMDSSSHSQRMISWGLPYGYIVLPVLYGEDDFEFNGLEISSDGKSGVSYTDILSSSAFIKNSTLGYGLSVSASKSESSATVSVSWKKPYENDSGIPFVYRRARGSGEWKLIASLSKDDDVYNDSLEGEDFTKAFYYAVQYHRSSSPLACTRSYEEHLGAKDLRYSDSSGVEELNKGYLFYISLSASYNGRRGPDGLWAKDGFYYSQKVSHSRWDFEERARGPSAITISAKNVNTTYGNIKLADIQIGSDGEENFTLNASGGVLNGDGNDTALVKNGSDLVLHPIAMTESLVAGNGEHTYTDGILKILRSSKTFYKLESTVSYSKTDGSGGEVFFVGEASGFRQFSDEELVKSVSLVLSDALYQAGIPKSSAAIFVVRDASSKCSGKTGEFTVTHTSWANHSQWGFGGTSYRHIFPSGTSSKYTEPYASDFVIRAGDSVKAVGIKENTLYHLPELELDIVHDSGISPCVLSYTLGTAGSLNFAGEGTGLNRTWILSVKKDGSQIVNADGEQAFLRVFPYDVGTAHGSPDASVNSSLKTYQGGWWN